MNLAADDALVQVEKIRAFPGLHASLPEQMVQRSPCNRAPAKAGNRGVKPRWSRQIAQRDIHIVGKLSAHADSDALLHDDDIIRAGESVAQRVDRKGPERDDDNETDANAILPHLVDRVLDRAADGTHRDHQHVGILGTIAP